MGEEDHTARLSVKIENSGLGEKAKEGGPERIPGNTFQKDPGYLTIREEDKSLGLHKES